MTSEGKIIKNTLINLSAYLIAYTLSTSILLSIMGGSSLFDVIPLLFTAFPMMFTGNLLPSLVGYGAIYLCNKAIRDDLVITTRTHFFTLLVITGIEVVGTIAYYANVGKFVGASFVLITYLIVDTIKTNKKYKALKNPPEVTEDTNNLDDAKSEDDNITNESKN